MSILFLVFCDIFLYTVDYRPTQFWQGSLGKNLESKFKIKV